MKKILLFIFYSIFIFPIHVNAENCSTTEISKINSLVNNIKITYNHVENNTFEINIYNIPKELYVLTPLNKKVYHNENNASKIEGYLGGNSYTFEIYSTNNNDCIDNMNFTKTIFVKNYNLYSDREICKDEKYKDFKYCNQWYQGSITDEKFEKELKIFEKENLEVELNPDNSKNNDYSVVIIASSISILILITLILIFKFKKRRRIKL